MKRILLLSALSFILFSVFAQKPVATIYSEDGFEFYVIMEGKQINEQPMSRVENILLEHDWAKVKIRFKDATLGSFDKTIQGLDVDGNPSSVTWVIKRNNKGKFKMSVSSFKPLEKEKQEMREEVAQPTRVEVAAEEKPVQTTIITSETTTNKQPNPEQSAISISAGGTSVNMQVGINASEDAESMNMNINFSEGNVQQSQSTTTTTTVTTTTSELHAENLQSEAYSEAEPEFLPGYNGRVGCSTPMGADRFETAKQSISSKDFEDSKLTIARQIMKSNCLFVSQVKAIMEMFDFEDTRLKFAKEAYQYTYDIDNYWELNDAFEFESSIDELNSHINNQ